LPAIETRLATEIRQRARALAEAISARADDSDRRELELELLLSARALELWSYIGARLAVDSGADASVKLRLPR
jgi:hypothetical protein